LPICIRPPSIKSSNERALVFSIQSKASSFAPLSAAMRLENDTN
jgi:hypothetical protein